ncbi:putative acytransferase [Burkholderiales bacterium]|nr:putative acytransferase [Burkholderiales bacterium]
MLARLPAALRGVLTGLTLGLDTIVVSLLMVPPALLKLLVPADVVRHGCDRALNALASGWVAVNNAWIAAVRPAHWDVQGVESLHPRGWYLVSSNHQSWVDILVLQRIFHGRIPFLKFFLKRELIWVPVIGLAWWALDFPFLQRGRGQGARQNDLKTTREACEKFKRIPTSVINFVEGTRCTPAKRARQKSPYRHLLQPRIGGLGIALATMGEQFEALLDVTIVYPHGTPRFWDLLCGRIDAVTVRVQRREIPSELLGSDPIGDKFYRKRISAWIEQQWSEKDQLIDQLLGAAPSAPSSPSP